MKRSSKQNKTTKMSKKIIKDKNIDDTLNSVFMKYMAEQLDEQTRLTKEYKRDMNQLIPLLTEFLDNFIVIGHDIIGNEVFMSYCKNQNDRNAMQKLFMDTFMRTMTKENNG